MIETDLTILGAGPVGIFASFQAGIMGMQSHVVDVLPFIGGQCTALYPEKPIYDIPGFPSILAKNLINNLSQQAEKFRPQYHLETVVESINPTNNFVEIELSSNVTLRSKFLLITGGNGIFKFNKPPLDGITELENRLVFYNVSNISKFKNKIVMIAGGGDSAVDWALEICKVAKKVILIHRRNKFSCLESSFLQLETCKKMQLLEVKTPYQLKAVKDIEPDSFSAEIKNSEAQDKIEMLCINRLLLLFGLKTNLGPIKKFNLEISNNKIVVEQNSMTTNLNRVYAAGDIAKYSNKMDLIMVGFSEAAAACNHMKNKDSKIGIDTRLHSTSNPVFTS